jgi:hypothetical protein
VLLASHHDALDGLFDQFARAGAHQERRAIAARICHLVLAQCDVEEEFLYPAATRSGRPDHRIRAAQIEGSFVRKVVAQVRALEDGGGDERRFAGTVDILREYLGDYLEQQRTDVLPRLRRPGRRLAELCQAMLRRRAELLAAGPGP